MIQRAGVLKRTESNVHATIDNAGPDVVWFTTLDTPDLDHGLDGGIADKKRIRITVEVPDQWAHHWLTWVDQYGIDPEWKTALIEGGGGHEAADTWFVTVRPVRRDRWIAVDKRVNGEWTPIPATS